MNTAVVKDLTATPELISAPVVAISGGAKTDGVVPPTPPAVEVKEIIVQEVDLKKDVKDNNITATPVLISAPVVAISGGAKTDGVVPPTPPAVEVKEKIVQEVDLKKDVKDNTTTATPVLISAPVVAISGGAKTDGIVPPVPSAVEVKEIIVQEVDLKKDVKDNNITATPVLISAPVVAISGGAKTDGIVPPTPPAVEVKEKIVQEVDLKKDVKDNTTTASRI